MFWKGELNALLEGPLGKVDFGLAGILDEENDPHPNLTKSRMTMGTVNYMAPEQRTDAKRVDQRAWQDLIIVGVERVRRANLPDQLAAADQLRTGQALAPWWDSRSARRRCGGDSSASWGTSGVARKGR